MLESKERFAYSPQRKTAAMTTNPSCKTVCLMEWSLRGSWKSRVFLLSILADSTLAPKHSIENFMPLVCLLPFDVPFLSVVPWFDQEELQYISIVLQLVSCRL